MKRKNTAVNYDEARKDNERGVLAHAEQEYDRGLHRDLDGKPQHHNSLQVAVRRKKVAELRLKNWSAQDIADYLGVGASTVKQDLSLVLAELDEATMEKGAQLRALVGARLDQQARKLQAIADSDVEAGTVVKALAELRKIETERARLYGAYEEPKDDFQDAVLALLSQPKRLAHSNAHVIEAQVIETEKINVET
jgi:predicted transcriptional regulator